MRSALGTSSRIRNGPMCCHFIIRSNISFFSGKANKNSNFSRKSSGSWYRVSGVGERNPEAQYEVAVLHDLRTRRTGQTGRTMRESKPHDTRRKGFLLLDIAPFIFLTTSHFFRDLSVLSVQSVTRGSITPTPLTRYENHSLRSVGVGKILGLQGLVSAIDGLTGLVGLVGLVGLGGRASEKLKLEDARGEQRIRKKS